FLTESSQSSFTSNDFPTEASTFNSASKEAYSPLIRSSKPLNTDSTITKAMVPTATPIMEIRDRTVMKFRFFLLRKYREAIKNERFKAKGINFLLPHLLPELLECSDQR